jgi:hypothetical protein
MARQRHFVLIVMSVVFLVSKANGQPTNRYRGLYQNDTYAYAVTLPPEITAIGASAPNPNHGFTTPLRAADASAKVYKSTDSYLWVDAFYVPADGVDSLSDAVKFNIRIAEGGLDTTLKVREEKETSWPILRQVMCIPISTYMGYE